MAALENLISQRFGRLVVLARDAGPGTRWLCACDCGKSHTVSAARLKSGKTRSCGCLRKEVTGRKNFIHGKTNCPEYHSWSNAKRRCYDPHNHKFAMYGGRGITMCDRWRNDFGAFLTDMGPKPSPQHSIERIWNDGPYSPENCRWATPREQARNTRRNRILELNGRRELLTDWAAIIGVTHSSLQERLQRGDSIERALRGAPSA